jgi:hypothetical protein
LTTNDCLRRDIDQAKELLSRVRGALGALNRMDGFRQEIVEREVKFRFDAIEGILLMARNDIEGMVKMWQAELKE